MSFDNYENLELASGTELTAQQAEQAGLLHYRLCQFSKAFDQYHKALGLYHELQDWKAYTRVLPQLLRLCIEMENDSLLTQLWQDFETLKSRPGFPYTSRAHYAIAIYFNYAGDPVRSHEHFKSALSLAISGEHHESEVYARIGLSAYYYTAGNTEMALSELSKAKQICYLNTNLGNDLLLSALVFESVIWRSQGQHELALQGLLEAQSQAKVELNLYIVLNILFNLCLTYLEMGETKKAQQQAEFARSITNIDLVRFNRALASAQSKIASTDKIEHDIYLEEGPNLKIKIRGRQAIALKNQYLLTELLKLLGQQPRRAWSKEEIVEALWGESYHPFKHDNKLYVTIRRLRCLIEINEKRPEIVIKNQQGYLLNKSFSFAIGQSN